MKIYEYDEIIDVLLDTSGDADEETGLVFDVTLLDRLEMNRNEKIENLLLYAAQLTSDAKEISEYATKLTARAKAKTAKADRLKEWLCSELMRYGDKKFETRRIKATVTTRNKVNIVDESKLPEKYIRTKVEKAPDKTAITAAIKAGEIVEGAELIENKTLQIK